MNESSLGKRKNNFITLSSLGVGKATKSLLRMESPVVEAFFDCSFASTLWARSSSQAWKIFQIKKKTNWFLSLAFFRNGLTFWKTRNKNPHLVPNFHDSVSIDGRHLHDGDVFLFQFLQNVSLLLGELIATQNINLKICFLWKSSKFWKKRIYKLKKKTFRNESFLRKII